MSRTEVFLRWVAVRSFILFLPTAVIVSWVTGKWMIAAATVLIYVPLWLVNEKLPEETKEIYTFVILLASGGVFLLVLLVGIANWILAVTGGAMVITDMAAIILFTWPRSLMKRLHFSEWG